MTVPVCPTHFAPMRPSAHGGYFCSKKNPDGSYCTAKVAAAQVAATMPQSPPQAPVWVAPTPQAPAAQSSLLNDAGDAHIAAAALRFAASIQASMPYEGGTLDQATDAALAIAIKALRTMKAYLP